MQNQQLFANSIRFTEKLQNVIRRQIANVCFRAVQTGVNLEKLFAKMNIWLQNLTSMQPRTGFTKFRLPNYIHPTPTPLRGSSKQLRGRARGRSVPPPVRSSRAVLPVRCRGRDPRLSRCTTRSLPLIGQIIAGVFFFIN